MCSISNYKLSSVFSFQIISPLWRLLLMSAVQNIFSFSTFRFSTINKGKLLQIKTIFFHVHCTNSIRRNSVQASLSNFIKYCQFSKVSSTVTKTYGNRELLLTKKEFFSSSEYFFIVYNKIENTFPFLFFEYKQKKGSRKDYFFQGHNLL